MLDAFSESDDSDLESIPALDALPTGNSYFLLNEWQDVSNVLMLKKIPYK